MGGAAIDIDTLQAASAKAVAAATKAVVAASEALAAASEFATVVAAYAASAAPAPRPEPEELKPETKAPLDDPTTDPAYVANYEKHYKTLSEKVRKALEYYKDTKDEEFELVEIGKFENKIHFPYWATHVTFMAKPKDDIPDSCPKLFFAEVYKGAGYATNEFEVKMCMTMDPSGPDVMKGCGYVEHYDMPHPKGVKFWAGPPSATPARMGL